MENGLPVGGGARLALPPLTSGLEGPGAPAGARLDTWALRGCRARSEHVRPPTTACFPVPHPPAALRPFRANPHPDAHTLSDAAQGRGISGSLAIPSTPRWPGPWKRRPSWAL